MIDLDIYYKPYSIKLEIYDKDWNSISDYDAFASPSSNAIHLEYLDCELAINGAGTFSLIIDDYEQAIDRNLLGISNKVIVYKGQDAAHYTRLFTGVCRYDENIRGRGDTLSYLLSGYGTQYITSERIINFAKSAPKKSDLVSTGSYLFDSNLEAKNLIKSILTETTSQPVAHPTVEESGDFDISVLDTSNVNSFIPAIYIPYTDASAGIDTITNLVGAEWGVDGDNKFYLKFPDISTDALDIIQVKSKPDYYNDDPTLASYMLAGEQRYGRSMRKEDGFANRLFALTASKQVVNSASQGTGGNDSLEDMAIAQQIRPGVTRFRDLALSLNKIGSPDTSSDPYLHGSIVLDSGNDSPNMIAKVGAFDIKLDDIPVGTSPTTIYKFNVTYADRMSIIPNQKYWLILHQIGELNDDKNTIQWYHNNDYSTPNQFSATKSPGTVRDDSNEEIGWMISDAGPTYSYAAFSSMRHVAVAWDSPSIDRYGLVDGFINNTAISDFDSMVKYLYAILQFSAKPKITYALTNVTIPLNHDIRPGQLVQIIDDVSGLTRTKGRFAEIMSVRYEFGQKGAVAGGGGGGSAEHSSAGTNYCTIAPMGYYQFDKEEPQEWL